jgi:3-oxoacyl-[acyl-carrier-protein] synthase II
MQLRRVVVTGLGALTPLGNTLKEYWEGLVSGRSGAAPITRFDASKFKTRFACEVKGFNPEDFIDRKEARKMDPYTQFAVVCADEAIKDSGLDTGQGGPRAHRGDLGQWHRGPEDLPGRVHRLR